MTNLREAAQMSLDVLEDINQCSLPPTGIPLPAEIDEAMDSLRAALAQPDQEPKKVIVLRGQWDKVVAIYRENDEEIIRAEMTKEELLKVWENND